ncbi:MAG: DMT family transporter [Blautia sp.]|nr:DMT family transporter [Blautia sp.]
MNSMKTRNQLLLVLASFIWGTTFVAQSKGGDVIGAFSFNCIRSLIGAAVLLIAILFLDRMGLSRAPQTKEEKKLLWIGGISTGTVLCLASNLQQVGINMGTSTGKAGFLTACYIVLVPVLGLFLKKKCGLNVWFSIGLTVIGLYLLCMTESFSLTLPDLLLLLCALVFSMQILLVDHFAPLVDSVRLSCIEFLTSGTLSIIPMVLADMGRTREQLSHWAGGFASVDVWISILYAGVLSCAVAYTLQIIGQQNVNPAVASLLMSLESVFSVLGGWLILHQQLSTRELLGCLLIFIAVLLAQIPIMQMKTT